MTSDDLYEPRDFAPPSWAEHAACVGIHPDVFFPKQGERPYRALKICAACVVRVPCLEDALEREEMYGVFGGTTETERRVMIEARRKAVVG